ncbi:aspartate aminotransferase [alpha proteobacterium U9-1i]|nr:aspartate aminotransferase [alpha proteobacterium U9-1i]
MTVSALNSGMKKGRGRLISAPAIEPGRALNEQITAHMRGLIQTGAIASGTRLPSQRLLARDLRVSRNTVLSVIERLTSEGLIESRRGSGTYVAARTNTPVAPPKFVDASPAPLAPFDVGAPALDLFPVDVWSKLHARRWQRLPHAVLGEGEPGGWRGLRAVIAQRVAALRGIACDPEQVLIVPSSQIAVELAARCLAQPGETAWVEDPGYWRTRDALRGAGLKVSPVSVDAQGFDVARARSTIQARIAAVTPLRHFPTGVVLPTQRRKDLIAWARAEEGWIIEDDFEADFCFDGVTPTALAAEAPDRVVYTFTFSPIMFPALRIAFLISPPSMVDRFIRARQRSDRMMSTPAEMVLQDFMMEGHLAAHVRACRAVYAERRAFLAEALRRRLGDRIDVSLPPVGLHLIAWLKDGGSDRQIKAAAAAAGVVVSAISDHALLPAKPGLFLGFAGYANAQLEDAVERLGAAFDAVGA